MSKKGVKAFTQLDYNRARSIAGKIRRGTVSPAVEIAKALAWSRREFAEHVAATADEDCDDVDGSVERLADLLSAEFRREEQSTFRAFRAPPQEDEDE